MKYINLLFFTILLFSCEFATKTNSYNDIKKYAFIYGVNDYSASSIAGDLRLPVNDAVEIEKILVASGYTTFLRTADTDSIPGSTVEIPNRPQFIADMATAKADLDENDLLVIFYAGHGGTVELSQEFQNNSIFSINKNSEFLYLHYNIDEPNTRVYDFELFEMLKEIKSKSVLMIDCCFSGGYKTPSPSYDPKEQEDYYRTVISEQRSIFEVTSLTSKFHNDYRELSPELKSFYKRNIILAAAKQTEESYEARIILISDERYHHGYFTLTLLLAFRDADYNNDGWISASEVSKYSRTNIEEIVESLRDSNAQTPTSNISNYDFIIAPKYEVEF
ncbi:MAG: caspase family protein [Spirochaetales bacterium]|nr:caspase family protein [Spirochaetales bacterium]